MTEKLRPLFTGLSGTCPDCREFHKHSEVNRPYGNSQVVSAVVAMVLVGLILPLILALMGSQLIGDLDDVNNVVGWIMTTAGALVMATVAVTSVFLYRTVYRRHNEVGYNVWAKLCKDGRAHIHLEPDQLGETEETRARILIRIAGGLNRCDIKFPAYNDPFTVTSRDGETLILEAYPNTVTTPDIGIALGLIAEQKGLSVIVRDVLPGYHQLQIYMQVFEQITAIEDPLGHGRSQHGQALQALVKRAHYVRDHNDTREALDIIKELKRQKVSASPPATEAP